MSFISFIGRLFFGAGNMASLSQIQDELSVEKAKIKDARTQLKGEIRRHAQMAESSSRLMQTMMNAMIMMESGRDRDR